MPCAELREGALDEFGFAFAHQAGIDIDAAHALGPRARRQSVKATVESTPPLTKKKTLRSPTRCADLFFDQGDALAGIPVFLAAADVENEILENARALAWCGRLRDGTELRRCRRAASSMAAVSQVEVVARTRKPAGGAVTTSRCDIQICW